MMAITADEMLDLSSFAGVELGLRRRKPLGNLSSTPYDDTRFV